MVDVDKKAKGYTPVAISKERGTDRVYHPESFMRWQTRIVKQFRYLIHITVTSPLRLRNPGRVTKACIPKDQSRRVHTRLLVAVNEK